ncbi:serine hydrolase [Carnobacteriaceae bacterium zg-ZUI78]|nr:serine hydrolase [Carnobacteriaceae bacterium zg-ZUI78]
MPNPKVMFVENTQQSTTQESIRETESEISSESVEKIEEKTVKKRQKSMEEKQDVMKADLAEMDAYGLYYDYPNLSLVDTVKAYLDEFGIDYKSIAFSYKDIDTNETFSMNDTQPMTAGSTYKLPLNMLVVDEVEAGRLSLDEAFDITGTTYEYKGEHDTYVSVFGGAMTIPQMQKYSLQYSENTPAYALADRLGGIEAAYAMFGRYGQSKADTKTIDLNNKTTTDYYIQVLEYLWNDREKYRDLIMYLGYSFPDEYYKTFVKVPVYQKPGYVREALNVCAIVEENKPYLVSIYTAGLGGSTIHSTEVSGVGAYQLGALAYVINEWHRVNMN